ncbi:hypothetical protein Palpr_1787 [Paludibacter propionicigenes WB4]|uniref:Uncharacterized protein n=1 Tax=Paludibacter propionicigenes (strain DSM 17365 / JCM 13257 / WB4) TaxID=694427 RepID=E4T5D2_PALPW|nr:hypothetical protein [Paludibacter propionicigenes]ADQ79926.1 hypothetical protein Palpr_1787 [Paludibacter propionicigenes WB4]
MPRDKAILKEQLAQLSKNELAEMVLKLAGKRYNYEFLLVNFLDKDGGEQTLFEEAREDIDQLFQKEFKGRTIQHQLVKKLNACTKRIGEFTIETKSKKLEADLVLHVLEKQFSHPINVFGARFSGYDYKVGLLLKRLINLITKKLHPDYLIDYQDKINEYLTKLHYTSNRINTIKDLPKTI